MAGYILHMIHAYETYMHLLAETKQKMSENALRSFLIGAIVPDLTGGVDKDQTHFCKNHPVYGYAYQIPDMEKVNKHFLKTEPTHLGVLSHLKYDTDHIQRFLLVYAHPCDNGEYENTVTGEKMSGEIFFGKSNGQLYKLYNYFNNELIKEYMPKFNKAFGTYFANDKDGFLEFVSWLFPKKIVTD